MGDLSVQAYYDNIRHLADLLERLGEKVKDRNHINYSPNSLSSKFENVANVLQHTKPLPSFFVMRSTLSVEETQLAAHTVPHLSHDHHSSSPSILYAGTNPPHHGKKSESWGRKQSPQKG